MDDQMDLKAERNGSSSVANHCSNREHGATDGGLRYRLVPVSQPTDSNRRGKGAVSG